MVRANRPRRLVPERSNALAVTGGTAVFGTFYSSIWMMANTLSPARHALITVFAVASDCEWLT